MTQAPAPPRGGKRTAWVNTFPSVLNFIAWLSHLSMKRPCRFWFVSVLQLRCLYHTNGLLVARAVCEPHSEPVFVHGATLCFCLFTLLCLLLPCLSSLQSAMSARTGTVQAVISDVFSSFWLCESK